MKILFIGNSHTYYNDFGKTVMDLLARDGITADVNINTVGGKSLEYHAARQDVRFNLLFGGYDLTFFQDRATDFDPALFRTGADKLCATAKEGGVKPYFYMPWAHANEREKQPVMTVAYVGYCKERGMKVAPAGEAFTELLGIYPPEELYMPDNNHATPFGSYVAALCVRYLLTGREVPEENDPVGLALGFSAGQIRDAHHAACTAVCRFN